MKKILPLALLGATSSLMAMYAEHAYLIKDTHLIGMGGANVAVGAQTTTVFSNPAGLTNITAEDGYVIDLLNLNLSATGQFQEFANDIQDASDSDNDSEIVEALEEYSGEHFHASVDGYTSLSKYEESYGFTWSVGAFFGTDTNVMTHSNGTDNGGFLQTTSRGYGGLVLAVAKPYDTEYGRFDVGVSAKYIAQKSVEGSLGVSDLTIDEDEIEDKLRDKYEKDATGYGIDLGVIYHPELESSLNPTIGLSVLNIGDMGLDDNYGQQPTTVNLGVAIAPEVVFTDRLVVALDYVDILEANKLRIYDYNDEGETVGYRDYDSSDFIKNINFGVGIDLLDSDYFDASLSAGVHQGGVTGGLNLAFFNSVSLDFSTYEEQVGTSDAEIADRRYMLRLGLSW